MILQEIEKHVRAWMDSMTDSLRKEQESLKTDLVTENQKTLDDVNQLKRELHSELEKAQETRKQDLDVMSTRKQEIEQLSNLVKQTQRNHEQKLEEVVEEVQRKMKTAASTKALRDLENEVDSIKKKQAGGNLIPIVLSVVSFALLVVALFLIQFGVFPFGRSEEEAITHETTTQQPTAIATPAPTPSPTSTPTDTPTPEPTVEPNPFDQLFEEYKQTQDKEGVVLYVLTKSLEESTEIGIEEPEGTNDAAGGITEPDAIDDMQQSTEELKTEDESSETLYVLLHLISTDGAREVTISVVNADLDAAIKAMKWVNRLKEIDPNAKYDWYPSHPLKEYVLTKELNNCYYTSMDDDLNLGEWFNPFEMLICIYTDTFNNVRGYYLLAARDMDKELAGVETIEHTNNYAYFGRVQLSTTADEIYGYVFAKTEFDAQEIAESLKIA